MWALGPAIIKKYSCGQKFTSIGMNVNRNFWLSLSCTFSVAEWLYILNRRREFAAQILIYYGFSEINSVSQRALSIFMWVWLHVFKTRKGVMNPGMRESNRSYSAKLCCNLSTISTLLLTSCSYKHLQVFSKCEVKRDQKREPYANLIWALWNMSLMVYSVHAVLLTRWYTVP